LGETPVQEEGEGRLEAGEPHHPDEGEQGQAPHRRAGISQGRYRADPARGDGISPIRSDIRDRGRRPGRQPHQRHHGVDSGETRRHEERQRPTPQGGQRPDERPDYEPQPECRSQQTQQAGTVLGFGQVGNGCLADRIRRPRSTVECPTQEQHPQDPGHSCHEAPDSRADQGRDQDRLAADPV